MYPSLSVSIVAMLFLAVLFGLVAGQDDGKPYRLLWWSESDFTSYHQRAMAHYSQHNDLLANFHQLLLWTYNRP
jgi:hypothetical protein